jgi:transcription factor SPN1
MPEFDLDNHSPQSRADQILEPNHLDVDDTANGASKATSFHPNPATVDDSDDESLLSEVDEAQFADFDATAVQVAPDLETLSKHIKPSKRKRVEGDIPKRKKEGRREKIKRSKRREDSDDGFSGGEELEGKRARRSKGTDGASREKKRRAPVVEAVNEDHLTPEERRRRALDRAMDAALKRPTARRGRKGYIVWLLFRSV